MPLNYSEQLTIALPRARVIELFNDPNNLTKWMAGLQSLEHLEGKPGEEGAKSRITVKMGKRVMVMTETLTRNHLPTEIDFHYECDGVHNDVKNQFVELSENETVWETINIFKFDGLFMKIMGKLMPFVFRKQTREHMESFKAFAERGAG